MSKEKFLSLTSVNAHSPKSAVPCLISSVDPLSPQSTTGSCYSSTDQSEKGVGLDAKEMGPLAFFNTKALCKLGIRFPETSALTAG